jgi:hypothetical protein
MPSLFSLSGDWWSRSQSKTYTNLGSLLSRLLDGFAQITVYNLRSRREANGGPRAQISIFGFCRSGFG